MSTYTPQPTPPPRPVTRLQSTIFLIPILPSDTQLINLSIYLLANMQLFKIVSAFMLVGAAAARYDGPCTAKACGDAGKACGTGLVCVPFPTFDQATRQGCACSGEFSTSTRRLGHSTYLDVRSCPG